MAEDVVRELEAAAKVMLAPPQLITTEQRHAAETVFLTFRKSRAPYGLCREIFERSRMDYVIFETATTVKEAIIREWRELSSEEIVALRRYLLDYVLQRPALAPFVRERILQVIAIMVKRESVTDFGLERGRILQDIEQLILNGDFSQQILGCSLISAMLLEYGNTVKSSDIGLTWETHFKVKKQLETTDLRKILELTVRALGKLMESQPEGAFSDSTLSLLKHLLSIAESVLIWGYITSQLPKRIIGAFESGYEAEQFPSLKLTAQWKELLLDPSLLSLFFNIHWRVRELGHIGHHSLSCLVQLASLTGPCLGNKEDRLRYYSTYIHAFIQLLERAEVLDREAVGVSNIVKNLMTYFPPPLMPTLPQALFYKFMTHVVQLTSFFIHGAAHEESMHWDDCMFTEACDNLLKVWMGVLKESQYFSLDFIKEGAVEIFNAYLKCHLSPPTGSRGSGRELESEEIEEVEEDDRLKFKDQLQSIGALGRKVCEHSVPLLEKLIGEKIASLEETLQKLYEGAPLDIAKSHQLSQLFEDIHWLLLIAGHTIAMESHGETALIPSEVMEYSIRENASTHETLALLASTLGLSAPPQPSHPNMISSQTPDPVVRLCCRILRLSLIEEMAMEAKLSHVLSPQVSSTVLWFLNHWSVDYLLPNEVYYTEMSLPLVTAFGEDSDGGKWTANYLLRKVEWNLRHWSSEPEIGELSVQLLTTLIQRRDKAETTVRSEGLWKLVGLAVEECGGGRGDSRLLTGKLKRGLMKALTLGGASAASIRSDYWPMVLGPLSLKFGSMVGDQNFKRSAQEEHVKVDVIDVLEAYIGVSEGSQVSTSNAIFDMLTPVIRECPTLLGIYSNYRVIVELILELLCTCTKAMLCYLTPRESKRLYESCIGTMEVYATTCARVSRSASESAAEREEEAYHDVQLLIELLTTLLSKDFLDLSPQVDEGEERAVSPVDVSFYGLTILVPLIDVELLDFPNLSIQYYKMLTFMSEVSPEKVVQLREDLLVRVLRTVELGLSSPVPDVNCLAADFIQSLVSFLHSSPDAQVFHHLKPFVKILMDIILLRRMNSDALANAGVALFVLICCYKDEYRVAVEEWLSRQEEASQRERLASAFNILTSNLQLIPDRPNKSKFRDSFENFLTQVHPFLLIK